MNVLIVGAGGMLGRKLAMAIARDGVVGGRAVDRLTMADIAAPPVPADFLGAVDTVAADIAEPGVAARLVANRPDIVFHLAAIVSGEAEQNFDLGYRVNLDGHARAV